MCDYTVGVACETVQIEHEHPYQPIIDTTKSKPCDLIVTASQGGRGIAAVVLGSETVKLTHSALVAWLVSPLLHLTRGGNSGTDSSAMGF
ncbi:MAG TPA: universal stress protein [Terriglobales bacterium]